MISIINQIKVRYVKYTLRYIKRKDMITVVVEKKMWKNKLSVVIALAVVDSLWVEALPTKSLIDENIDDIDYPGFNVLECPENESLNHEGKACEPTCDAPIRSNTCTKEKVIACECADGYLRNTTGTCVKPDECDYGIPENITNLLSQSESDNNRKIIDSIISAFNIDSSETNNSMLEKNLKDQLLDQDYNDARFESYSLAEIDQLMRMNSEEYDTYQKNHRKQYLPKNRNTMHDLISNEIIEEMVENYSVNSGNESLNDGFIDILEWKPVIF